jgi:hypothetical protein
VKATFFFASSCLLIFNIDFIAFLVRKYGAAFALAVAMPGAVFLILYYSRKVISNLPGSVKSRRITNCEIMAAMA